MELMIVGFALMTTALIFFFSFKNRYKGSKEKQRSCIHHARELFSIDCPAFKLNLLITVFRFTYYLVDISTFVCNKSC